MSLSADPLQATGFWVLGPGRGALRTRPLRMPPDGAVLVEALYSGISRGTESTVFHGRVPPAVADAMAAPFQQGDFPGPVLYGYASVGRVVEAPLSDRRPGDLVFCLFPHQDRYVVPAEATRLVPPGVPARRAVLAANMETALNAVWDAGIGPGDRVAVVGGGVVGALIAWLAGRVPATAVTLVDVRRERAALAQALGVQFAAPADAPPEQDVVVHTSATDAGLATALSLAGDEAVVLEVSWYGARPVRAPLGGAFHHRRLQLRSSQVGGLPPQRSPRWGYHRRLDTALRLLEDPRLDALLEPDIPFSRLPERMPVVLADGAGGLCHPVAYPEPP